MCARHVASPAAPPPWAKPPAHNEGPIRHQLFKVVAASGSGIYGGDGAPHSGTHRGGRGTDGSGTTAGGRARPGRDCGRACDSEFRARVIAAVSWHSTNEDSALVPRLIADGLGELELTHAGQMDSGCDKPTGSSFSAAVFRPGTRSGRRRPTLAGACTGRTSGRCESRRPQRRGHRHRRPGVRPPVPTCAPRLGRRAAPLARRPGPGRGRCRDREVRSPRAVDGEGEVTASGAVAPSPPSCRTRGEVRG